MTKSWWQSRPAMWQGGGSGAVAVELQRPLRVLALTEEFPYPPDCGWKLRTWNLLVRLARHHEITLVACAAPRDADAARELERQGFHVAPVWHSPGRKAGPGFYLSLLASLADRSPYVVSRHRSAPLRERLRELLQEGEFDLVHCDWTPLLVNLPPEALGRTIVTGHNVETQIWKRYRQVERGALRRWYIGRQVAKMEAFERWAFRASRLVVAVSAGDAELARSGFGCPRVRIVENGVDTEFFRPDDGSDAPGRLLYAGSMDTLANADAVHWFVQEVLPEVRRSHPSVSLDIVGRNPTPAVKSLAKRPGVRVTGGVEDVRPYYDQAQVVVVPLRVGGGTRLKILEAWAMGKAVVSTSVGSEGLAAVGGRQLLLADSPADFAGATASLLASPAERRRLGEAGRRVAVERYDWRRLSAALAAIWQEAVGAATAAT